MIFIIVNMFVKCIIYLFVHKFLMSLINYYDEDKIVSGLHRLLLISFCDYPLH